MTAYDVTMRIPTLPSGTAEKTLRVTAVNPGSAIAEAAMDLDRVGIRDCEFVDLAEVEA